MSYHQNHGQSTYRKFRGTYKVFCCSNTLSRCLMALARSGFRRWSTNSSNFLTFSCRARASATAMAMGPSRVPPIRLADHGGRCRSGPLLRPSVALVRLSFQCSKHPAGHAPYLPRATPPSSSCAATGELGELLVMGTG